MVATKGNKPGKAYQQWRVDHRNTVIGIPKVPKEKSAKSDIDKVLDSFDKLQLRSVPKGQKKKRREDVKDHAMRSRKQVVTKVADTSLADLMQKLTFQRTHPKRAKSVKKNMLRAAQANHLSPARFEYELKKPLDKPLSASIDLFDRLRASGKRPEPGLDYQAVVKRSSGQMSGLHVKHTDGPPSDRLDLMRKLALVTVAAMRDSSRQHSRSQKGEDQHHKFANDPISGDSGEIAWENAEDETVNAIEGSDKSSESQIDTS